LDAADEMLRRYEELQKKEEWGKTPVLVLNHEKKNFYEFTIDDFVIENYSPMKPQLNLEIGI
jgi:thymidylate synthase